MPSRNLITSSIEPTNTATQKLAAEPRNRAKKTFWEVCPLSIMNPTPKNNIKEIRVKMTVANRCLNHTAPATTMRHGNASKIASVGNSVIITP